MAEKTSGDDRRFLLRASRSLRAWAEEKQNRGEGDQVMDSYFVVGCSADGLTFDGPLTRHELEKRLDSGNYDGERQDVSSRRHRRRTASPSRWVRTSCSSSRERWCSRSPRRPSSAGISAGDERPRTPAALGGQPQEAQTRRHDLRRGDRRRLVALFILLYSAQDREERACRARGGSYDCKTSTGIGIGADGKTGTVMMTTCECSVSEK